ncbi:MAG: hypothetical protein FWG99_09535 [Treponema sp.]|nr:hypothetical protein [Treponema sp.]
MKLMIVRLLSVMIGLIFYALGIVVTIKANIGYAPWDVFHVGFANTFGISIGLSSIIVGLVIVVILIILKEKIGLGTVLNMILIGAFIDIIMAINIIPTPNILVINILMLIAGLFLISIGSFFYIRSAFGIGPRDNLMVVLTKRTKIPVGICRSIIELLATVIGWRLGGMVGIGTIISVIGIGFCIQITFRILRFDIASVKHESIFETFNVLIKR